MTEQELLLDCLQRLNRQPVADMLTGSMASNAWGIPRPTHDLDFVVQLPPGQMPGCVEAFRSDDYYLNEAMIRSAYHPPHQFNATHIPSALKVDFWILQAHAFEREMFQRRVKDFWLGETVWLATAEDVVLHKVYWHQLTPSERQPGDVAVGVAVQRGNLDETDLRHRANESGVTGELNRALSGALRPQHT